MVGAGVTDQLGHVGLGHHQLLERVGAGRALDHGEVDVDRIVLGPDEERPPWRAGHHHGNGVDENHQHPNQQRIARPDEEGDHGPEQAQPYVLEAGVKAGPEARDRSVDRRRVAIARAQASLGTLPLLEGVVHMPGQDEETLDQRGDQHRDHRHRDIAGDRPQPAGQEIQHPEGDDGGGRRGDHRPDHALGPDNGGLGGLVALLVQEVRVLPHHNGIIDDDPQRQDQREQREHVDRQAQRPHDPQRRSDRHRNTNSDPERRAHVEEQEQEGEHDQHAVERVIAQQQHPAEDQVGADIVVLDGDVGGKGRPDLFEVLADHGLLADGIALRPAPDLQRDGGLALKVDGAAGVGDGFSDLRHVADADHSAVWLGADRRVRDAVGAGFGAQRAHRPLPTQRPGGQIIGPTGDGGGNVGGGQAQPPKGGFIDLDLDLRIAGALHVDFEQATVQQVVAHALGDGLKPGLRQWPGDQDRRDGVAEG
ncbi:MAG: Uncharacterised protein [Rhodospirillaceae bacterium]|nr:MAG: Uncharacterised protein [Rhodospirillaceae bacterium]